MAVYKTTNTVTIEYFDEESKIRVSGENVGGRITLRTYTGDNKFKFYNSDPVRVIKVLKALLDVSRKLIICNIKISLEQNQKKGGDANAENQKH